MPDQDTEFYRLGSSLLGWSLREGKAVDFPRFKDFRMKNEYIRKAARYGFHSSVIAPFRTERSGSSVEAWARRGILGNGPVRLPPLRLSLLRGRPVLSSKNPIPDFMALEKSLLESLSGIFLPPDPNSLAKRGELNPRQLEFFWKWGYPFILDEHRFHFTLGDDHCPDGYIKALKGYFPDEVLENLVMDKVSLCVERKPGDFFELLTDIKLG
ncbi:MAG: DUF1045 domain-containing protein [Deltaproteobacteria bacterium]|nr:DUF1045 domain-containing protein [Deltaproteobacteria bacterium]